MTTERTLRRKLQKKAKHKPYRRCPKCGARMEVQLTEVENHWRLFRYCGWFRTNLGMSGRELGCEPTPWRGGCGYIQELFWSGGGTGRHIPHEATLPSTFLRAAAE